MSSLLKITKELLAVHNRRPRKSLGQNFLVDPQVLERIVDTAQLSPDDIVLEIGTGLGVLTNAMAEKVCKVITLDPDLEMLGMAKSVLGKHGNIEFIPESFLEYDPCLRGWPFNKIVANVPYYITTPIIEKILSWEKKPELVILTVQKKAQSNIASLVSRRSFYPAPNVESAILVLKPYDKPLYDIDEKVVRAAFSQRRKTIRNTLKAFNVDFEKKGIDSSRRAETLSLEELQELSHS